jgi:type II secretory pathway component PulF
MADKITGCTPLMRLAALVALSIAVLPIVVNVLMQMTSRLPRSTLTWRAFAGILLTFFPWLGKTRGP